MGNSDNRITVHGASATAREKVEATGGTLNLLKEAKVRKPKNMKRRPEGRVSAKDGDTPEAAPDAAPDAPETAEATEPAESEA